VSADPSAVRELVGTYKSRSTPTIVVDDKVMIGFNPAQLEEWLKE